MSTEPESTWRVISDFEGFCIDSKTPEGYQKKFRKHERISGERKEVGGGVVTIAGANLAIFGVPVTAISADGRNNNPRTGRQQSMV